MRTLSIKSFSAFFFFLNITYCQTPLDTLFSSEGKVLPGFYDFDKKDVNFLYFKFKGQKNPSKIPKDKVLKIKVKNQAMIDLTTNNIIDLATDEIISFEELNKIIEDKRTLEEFNRLKKEKEKICESNSRVKFIVLPLKNDKYAITQNHINELESKCYNVINNYYALEYFNKNDIKLNDINDYDIIMMAKSLKIDQVVFGDVFTTEEPYKYTPGLGDYLTASELRKSQSSDLLKGIIKAIEDQKQKDKEAFENLRQSIAVTKAGTYLYETIYVIDPTTMKREYVLTNSLVFKFEQ